MKIHNDGTGSIRVNFMLPKYLYEDMKRHIPVRKRSILITRLVKEELAKRDKKLYEIAKSVEEDKALNEEMAEWNIALNDGLEEHEWK